MKLGFGLQEISMSGGSWKYCTILVNGKLCVPLKVMRLDAKGKGRNHAYIQYVVIPALQAHLQCFADSVLKLFQD